MDFHFLPGYGALEKFTGEARKKGGVVFEPWPLFLAGVSLMFMSFVFFRYTIAQAVSIAIFLSPLWLPFLVSGAAWFLWITLIRSQFIANQNHILLEIIPPRTIAKTPLAMETVFAGMHHAPGEGNWYKKYIVGAVRPWWSLEIVSLEGRVHFYVWTRAAFRRLIEAQIYAQYPGAQVVEAEDYSRSIAWPDDVDIWGCEFAHTKPDPYPIKTYVEYGLDKVAKENEQVDPLANLIEFMGSMRKGEYLWLQMIIRVPKWEKYGGLKNWKDEAKEIVQKIREDTRSKFVDAEGVEQPGFPNPTKQQIDTMAAIERNVAKLPFDVGIRGIYLARKGKFDSINISGLVGIFKQFGSEGWNGFFPTRGLTPFEDYPWEVGTSKRKVGAKVELMDSYRRRQYFHEPYPRPDYMTMSVEELATLYHVPSMAVEAPSLARIQSSTGEAPPNLPT